MIKVLGVFLIAAGVFILVGDLLLIIIGAVGMAAAIFFLVAGALCLFFGIKQLSAPTSKQSPAAGSRSTPAPDPNLKKYKFKVSGISFRKNEISEELGDYNDDYEMTKKQLLDEGMVDEEIHKYNVYVSKVELVDDPDNPYDPNAMKVVADGVHIGFVPKEKKARVREILSSNIDIKISCDVYGGDYKILEEDDDGNCSVNQVEQNYGAEITITYREPGSAAL